MFKATMCLGFAALFAGAVAGQLPNRLAFEAADVHFSGVTQTLMKGPYIAGQRFEVRTASMLDLIVAAYGEDPDRIAAGPTWLESDRFDIIAQLPPGTSPDASKTMLRTLLEERFKLVAHQGSRPQPAYALTLGTKPLLKEPASSTAEPGCKQAPLTSGSSETSFSCRNMTMDAFIEAMRATPSMNTFLAGRRVVDQTGLKGAWDFDFKFNRKLPAQAAVAAAAAGEATVSLFEALQKQAGLELTLTDVSMPALVIDSVNRRPSENVPDIGQLLPALPAEFEVADIKPALTGRGTIELQPGGRVVIENLSLRILIQNAWRLGTNERLIGPKFIDTEHFAIIAKAPLLATLVPTGRGQRGPAAAFDQQSMTPMLKSFLIDQFKIVAHYEDRPVTTFVLTAPKPKLQPADPARRTSCHGGPGADGKDPRTPNGPNGILETCENVTMAQFAEIINGFAPAYINQAPVIDETGLSGSFDFTLNYAAGALGRLAVGDAASPTADPSGALTLFEALQKLGLKLEVTKRPAPVLVIDQMEQMPKALSRLARHSGPELFLQFCARQLPDCAQRGLSGIQAETKVFIGIGAIDVDRLMPCWGPSSPGLHAALILAQAYRGN